MGRTKRKRDRKKKCVSPISLDSSCSVIDLQRWMKLNNWENINALRLSMFPTTGRGLGAPKKISKYDTLIEIPYELMITYTTLENSFLSDALLPSATGKLKMHDLLSIYLAFEQHKGCKSKWKTYLDSLPHCAVPLPWLCHEEEIARIPEDLQALVRENRSNFKSSWRRSKESIDPRWKCECCKTPGHCVLTLNSFTWSYVMVNTRAVYVDPNIVRGLSRCSANNLGNALSDDPCMALCPYLDMFNHSNKAATNAELKNLNERWVFSLITLTTTPKYEEIFISYGSHDNSKLLCEYGFFIPDIELDAISFDFNEVLKIGKLSLNERQYKFIRKRCLDRELSVSADGVSFNLKAVLFVALNCGVGDWCPYVFSENYSEKDMLEMLNVTKLLVQFKIDKYTKEVYDLSSTLKKMSESFQKLLNYCTYKVTFMNCVLNTICK